MYKLNNIIQSQTFHIRREPETRETKGDTNYFIETQDQSGAG